MTGTVSSKGPGVLRRFRTRASRYLDNHFFSEDHLIAHLSFWTRLVYRRRRPFIIGITGSVGKSTTTELVATVLTHPKAKASAGPIRKTTNNMNHYPGLPLTFLGWHRLCKDLHERIRLILILPFRALWLLGPGRFPKVCVLEYGTDKTGYLQKLVDLIPPDIGVVTAVGPAHLEGLGSIEGVALEKSTVARAVPPNGLVILGEGHDYVDFIAAKCRARVVRCSGKGTELAAEIARVIGRRFGIPNPAIEEAIRSAKPPERRLCRIDLEGITVIDDTYNANPLSMRLGLDTLSEIAGQGARRRVAVLGTMAELGDSGPELHAEIGRLARQRADFIVGVGTLAKHYQPDVWYPDSVACSQAIEQFIRANDVLLVKGSASVQMRTIVEGLRFFRDTTPPSERAAAS